MEAHHKIRNYFCSGNFTIVNQSIVAFALGLLLGPFCARLIYRLGTLIIYELIIIYFTRCESPYWQVEGRILVIIFGLSGFFLGRWLVLGRIN